VAGNQSESKFLRKPLLRDLNSLFDLGDIGSDPLASGGLASGFTADDRGHGTGPLEGGYAALGGMLVQLLVIDTVHGGRRNPPLIHNIRE
jgi:hypothetical protein